MNNLIEKLKVYEDEYLPDEQLLSMAIWGEKINDKKIKIAKNLIENNKDFTGDLSFLTQISIEELTHQGLKEDEAIRLKAFSKLLKKLSSPITPSLVEISSSEEVAKLFMQELRYEKTEYIKLVILSTRNQILKIITLSKGTTNGASITPKEILSEPVKMKATRIILIHNHPSRKFKT